MKYFLKELILSALFSSAAVFAQFDSTETATEEVIDDLLEEPSEEIDNSDLYEVFEDLHRNPVDINSAGVSDFQRIPLLNFSDINKIISHREKYGRFFSTSELYSVQGIQAGTIRKILPFVKIIPQNKSRISGPAKNVLGAFYFNPGLEVRSRTVKDLQPRDGFVDNKFEGSAYKVYNRLLGKVNENLRFGLLTEKDAGEKPLNEFTSLYLEAKNMGAVKKLIIGDYSLEFGQGLALWSPFSFSKGTDAVFSVKKNGRGISPFKSTDENRFFRGAASQINLNFMNASFFYSRNYFDAGLDSASRSILSIPIDGLHRTDSELEKRKSAVESFYGLNIDKEWNESIKTGLLFYYSIFSNPFLPSSAFKLSGKDFRYYSVYFDLIFSSMNLFGEAAYNGTSVASTAGIIFSPEKNFSFAVSLRNYPANYFNLHGFGFGESPATQNEFGFYTGIKWNTSIGTINFYYDQFKFPYATYYNPLPSQGEELLLGISSTPFSSIETRIRYKYEKKNISEAINNLTSVIDRLRQSIRAEMSYRINKYITLKGRFEYNKFNIKDAGQNEEGILVYQEIKFNAARWLSFTGRMILFKTDSFNSAVYEYESGLNGILYNPALYGEGLRWYAVVKVKPVHILVISFKYAETYKPEEKTLGSGYSTINGNLDNNFILQVDLSL